MFVVFDGGCHWVWVRGLESKLGSGWFERAESVAFERRGWNNSRVKRLSGFRVFSVHDDHIHPAMA